MINIKDKTGCCGCSACFNICPKNAIIMKPDNEGFLYPDIQEELCVNCGLCEKVCPIQNPMQEIQKEQTAYLFQNSNDRVREESTSGGAFTAIGEYVLNRGGVVVGAAYDEEFRIIHSIAESTFELRKFRNSKYAQSNMQDIYRQIRKLLDSGRFVCFSGTPCQVEGLLSFLRKKYDNLLCVDIVCHAVPSPKLWEKYLQYQSSKVKDATNILFRDKKPYGYKYSSMSIYKGNDVIYRNGVESDKMLRAFFSEIADRPSCYDCKFKKRYRESDITIWDCFEVYRFSQKLDDDKGTTRVLIHSESGRKVMDEVLKDNISLQVSADALCVGVKEMVFSVKKNPKRDAFFADMDKLETTEFFNKYFPDDGIMYLKKTARRILIITGLYSFAKKLKQKMKRR